MSEFVSPAVVLRTRQLRESDLIVVVLTPGRGKIDCIARGARRSRRRFPGGLPVGARGEIAVGRGRGALEVLSSFTPTSDHGGLGRDLEVFAYVAYLCELCEQLVDGQSADPGTFARLCEALEATLSPPDPGAGGRPALLRRFELGLLDGLGLLPSLDGCGVCGLPGHETEEGIAFSVARGGVLCLAHSRAARRLDPAILRLAEILLHADADARAEAYAGASRELRRGVRDLCRELIQPQLRGPLRSLAFFAQLAAPPPATPKT